MELLFWISLVLTNLPVTESMRKVNDCLRQPQKEILKERGQVVVLPCNGSSECLAIGVRYEWFLFKEHSHVRLNLRDNPLKYTLNGASLRIKSLQKNDSGIYHCAAVCSELTAESGTQHVGPGTVLTVTGNVKTVASNILLWSSFVLLVIYSIAIVTLIILKKHGRKNYSTKTTKFHDVLQEMNSRRNLEKGQSSLQVEAANAKFNRSADDIYQNV
ncbi:immunoglobulin superfamily member 6 [Solea senegalensis]|uniref:uncharacterized protein si:ch211-139g16.8 n=1 Tax=Solea senegalensis TaxID=28829 RepID=UPI001C414541|nr:uncharacterized protein si:ch211-139g16.8 [Solea senegalensis]KAG7505343.1 immunoglobulin superfamily member 6 [Solea senegalensis]